MLIIVPIVMLTVAALIVGITALTSDSLQIRAKAERTYQMQAGLDIIEKNIVKTMTFPASITPTVGYKQGSDNADTAFTAAASGSGTTSVLIVQLPATDKSPLNSSRTILYATGGTLNTCASGKATTNPVYPVSYIYFVSNGTLYERTIITINGQSYTAARGCAGTTETDVWQRGTCASGYTSSGCKGDDVIVASNVSTFALSYQDKAGAVVGRASATGILLTLTTTQSIAGQDIAITLNLNTQSQNL